MTLSKYQKIFYTEIEIWELNNPSFLRRKTGYRITNLRYYFQQNFTCKRIH